MTSATRFKNHQWRIRGNKIESAEASFPYEIDRERLTETTERNGVVYYDWPVHMAEKTWVDAAAFNEAFTQALHLFGVKADKAMVARSISYANKLGAER